MDRRIVHPGQIPLEDDILETNKNAMIGLSKLIEAVFGTTTLLHGFACTPTAPTSLQVKVAAGAVLSLQSVDATPFGSLPADLAHAIVKQGLILDETTLNCPAPGTGGFSINYLVQIAFSESDVEPTLRTYYNAANPAEPFLGANNNGVPDATRRKAQALVQVKAGVAATTGAQVTPAPDVGFIGAWVVTVDNGQATIEAADIVVAGGAPFLTEHLQDKISQTGGDARWVQKTGSVMSGPLTLPGNPTNPLEAAPKQYVDALGSGIQIKASVRVATTAAGTLASSFENGDTIDGVALATGNRILIKNQAAPAENGVYTVNASGAPTRATDMDAWAEVPGAMVLVTGGSTLAGSSWLCSSAPGGTLNTTAITFEAFANAGTYQQANALLSAIAVLGANGILVRTAAGGAAVRSIVAGAGISVANGDGVAGNPTVAADKADVAAVRSATANKLLDAATPYAAAASVDLAAAGAIVFDMAAAINAKHTINGNVTFNAPANVRDGQHFKIEITQDATGGRTASFHANWLFSGGIDPILSTTPGARDVLFGVGLADGKVLASLHKAIA